MAMRDDYLSVCYPLCGRVIAKTALSIETFTKCSKCGKNIVLQ